MIAWNEFLFAFMFLDDPSTFTLPKAVKSLNSSEISRQNLMAGAVISTVPIVVVFLAAERLMVNGLTSGGEGMSQKSIAAALEILRTNDRGEFSVPTHGLYPVQFNWDSAFASLGYVLLIQSALIVRLSCCLKRSGKTGWCPHYLPR